MEPFDDSAQLSERACGGDREALETLLVRHLPRLRAFVRIRSGALVRAHEESSDIVQSVCREVLLHAEQFRFPTEGAFRQWLFSHALRKIGKRARYYRALKRDAPRAQAAPAEAASQAGDDAAMMQCYASFATPSAEADAREQMRRVEAALDQLTEEQREVVTLAYLVGLTRAEIGEQIGKSEGSVRVILHRALMRIAALLDTGETT